MVLSLILSEVTVTPLGTDSVTAYHHILSPFLLVMVTDPDEPEEGLLTGEGVTGEGVEGEDGDGVDLVDGVDGVEGVDGTDPLDSPKFEPKSHSVSPAVEPIQPSQLTLSPLSLVICTDKGTVSGNPPEQIQNEGPLAFVHVVLHEVLPDDFNFTELTAPYPATSSRCRPYQYADVPDLERILIFPV